MSIFCQITLELRGAVAAAKFYEIMEIVVPVAEAGGWKLCGAYSHSTGRLYTVIDIWELEDYNHYARTAQAIFQHPRFPEISAVFAETVLSETVVFLEKVPYMRY